MQSDRNLTVAEEEDRIDMAILGLLLERGTRDPWSVEEVVREIGDKIAVLDSLVRLHGAGLAHLCGDFVLATRAAQRFDALVQ